MNVFKSKIDKEILICFILAIIACPLGASVMLKEGGAINYALATSILIFGAGFPLWILTSTKYIIKKEYLEITSGPFSWNIPIKSIKLVQETQSAITSPALSFDRLEIIYDEDKVILVSPAKKIEFMQKLDNEKLLSTGNNVQQRTTGKIPKNSARKIKKISKKPKAM
jgi:hypothetical protein